MNQKNNFCSLIFFGVILTSCCSINQLTPPYYVTNQEVNIGDYKDLYSYVGASISIYNKSEKTIAKMIIAFNVFDEDENYFGYGTNSVCSDFIGIIKPKETEKIIINLDSVLGSHLENGLQIDNLYIKQITYTDGSVWSDPLGLFAW